MTHCFPNGLTDREIVLRMDSADRMFEAELMGVAEALHRIDGLRFFGLTGPTCSGKTTAARMLTDRLENYGYHIHIVSIDDFYFEKTYLHTLSERKGNAELDYDSEDTIDVSLLGECAESLLAGKPTCLPHFNFLTGLRESGAKIVPAKDDLFLFEGIQILYPKVYAILRGESYRSIGICPMSAITTGGFTFEPNEIRLMRRIVRDEIYRASSASFTLSLWNSVRANEEKNIFPNLATCSHVVDSTMPYEIGVLKPYLEKSLREVFESDQNAGHAEKILSAVKNVQPIDSSRIADKSLYREFI